MYDEFVEGNIKGIMRQQPNRDGATPGWTLWLGYQFLFIK